MGLALTLGPDPYGLYSKSSLSRSDSNLLSKFKSESRSAAAEQAVRIKQMGKVDKANSEVDPYNINASNTAFPLQCNVDTMIIRSSSRASRSLIATESLNLIKYGVSAKEFVLPFQDGPPQAYKM